MDIIVIGENGIANSAEAGDRNEGVVAESELLVLGRIGIELELEVVGLEIVDGLNLAEDGVEMPIECSFLLLLLLLLSVDDSQLEGEQFIAEQLKLFDLHLPPN